MRRATYGLICLFSVLLCVIPTSATVRADAPTGVVTPSQDGEMLEIRITQPDGRSVMAFLPAVEGRFVRISFQATGEVLKFEAVHAKVADDRLIPRDGLWRVKVTRQAPGSPTLLELAEIGKPFHLKPAGASSATVGWSKDASMHKDTLPLSDRVISLRVRALGTDWVTGGVLEGQLFRVVREATGQGIALAPVHRPEGLTIHVYALQETAAGEGLHFQEVVDFSAGKALHFQDDVLYEIELVTSDDVDGLEALTLTGVPFSNVDNSQCWIHCIEWSAHGCWIASCGQACCGDRCCPM